MHVDCGRLSSRSIYLFTLSRRSIGRKGGRYTFLQSKKHASPNNTQLVSMEGVFVQPQTEALKLIILIIIINQNIVN